MPKFTLPRDELLAALQYIGGAVEKRGTLPVLTHVLMAWKGGKLRLTGTDLETQMVAELNAEGGDFAACLPFEKLAGVCKLLPPKIDVSLDFADDKAILKGGKSRHTLTTLPAENFPEFPTEAETARCTLGVNTLAEAFGRVLYAAAIEDVRYYLKGVLMDFTSNGFRVVASDGHRLAVYESRDEVAVERQIIVPRKAAQELLKLLGGKGIGDTVGMVLAPNLIRIKFESGWEFSTKLVEGRWPDLQRLIPRETLPPIVIDRTEMLGALARAAIPLAGEKFKQVKLSHDGRAEFRIEAMAKEGGGEAEERIDVAYTGGEPEFGVNAPYVVDVMNALDTARVSLRFRAENNALLIQGDVEGAPDQHLIMGVRL